MERKTRNLIILFILYYIVVFLLVIPIYHFLQVPLAENIPYSQFKQLVKERMVKELVVSEKDIRGEITAESVKSLFSAQYLEQIAHDGKSDLRFKTLRVDDPDLARELGEAGVRF